MGQEVEYNDNPQKCRYEYLKYAAIISAKTMYANSSFASRSPTLYRPQKHNTFTDDSFTFTSRVVLFSFFGSASETIGSIRWVSRALPSIAYNTITNLTSPLIVWMSFEHLTIWTETCQHCRSFLHNSLFAIKPTWSKPPCWMKFQKE